MTDLSVKNYTSVTLLCLTEDDPRVYKDLSDQTAQVQRAGDLMP